MKYMEEKILKSGISEKKHQEWLYFGYKNITDDM